MVTTEKRFGFTEARLKALQPTTITQTYFDTKTPGLTFNVTPNGAKAYYWYRRVPGRESARRHKWGNSPAMSLEGKPNGARALAARYSGKVDAGFDPIAEIEVERMKAASDEATAKAAA